MKKLITILTAITMLFSTAAMPVCADSENAVNTTEKSSKQEQVTLSPPVFTVKALSKSKIKISWNNMGATLNWYKEEDCSRPFMKRPFLYAKHSHIFITSYFNSFSI